MNVEIVWRDMRGTLPPEIRVGREYVDGQHVADVLYDHGNRFRRPRDTMRWARTDLVLCEGASS